MSLRIRMSRGGAKKRPYYHIVVADSRFPRDGRFIEKIGRFDPLLPKDHAERLVFDADKAKEWLAKGAKPSDRVHRFLDAAGILKREPRNNPIKAQPGKKRVEREEARRQAEEEAKQKAEEEAAAAAEAPAAEAPAEEAAAEAPAEDAPAAEEAPAAEAPAEEAAAEAPAEDALAAEEAPAAEAAAAEAPAEAEEAPADGAAADEAPADEDGKKD